MVLKRLMWLPRLLVGLLLCALLAVSPAAAKSKNASQRPSMQASTITDGRIDESSSLALSRSDSRLAYTANDNPKPIVFAIDINSGDVVGTTRFWRTNVGDPEALAIDPQGTLWVADIGDNLERRSDVALYAFPEQGRRNRTVTANRYPISYSDGRPHNAETLLINPSTNRKFIVTKVMDSAGSVYALPAQLRRDQPNVATKLSRTMPAKVSDGSFSPSGSWIAIRNNARLYTLDPSSWAVARSVPSPPLKQGESLGFNRFGTGFLVGSEGTNSPLVWVAFNDSDGAMSTR